MPDDRTVAIRLKSPDGIPMPKEALSVATTVGPTQLREVVTQCFDEDSPWREKVATFAFNIKGIPLTESLRETIEECVNAGIVGVNYEVIVPVSVWLPYEPPTSSHHLPAPAWTLGVYVDNDFLCMARVDGTVTVQRIPRKEKKEFSAVAERTMMYDENYQAHKKDGGGSQVSMQPLSHRSLEGWTHNEQLHLAVGSTNGQLRLCAVDADKGAITVTHQCVGHERDVNDVRVHEQRTHMASVCSQGLLKIWATREEQGESAEVDAKKARKSRNGDDVTSEGVKITPRVTLDLATNNEPTVLSCLRWMAKASHQCVVSGHLPYLISVDTTTARVTERRECARAMLRLDNHYEDDRLLATALDNNIRIYDYRQSAGDTATFIPDVGGTVRDAQWLGPGAAAHAFAAIVDDGHVPMVAFYDARFGDTPIHRRRVLWADDNSNTQRILKLAASRHESTSSTVPLACACEAGVQLYRLPKV